MLGGCSWWWFDVSMSCFKYLEQAFKGAGAESKAWEEHLEEGMSYVVCEDCKGDN